MEPPAANPYVIHATDPASALTQLLEQCCKFWGPHDTLLQGLELFVALYLERQSKHQDEIKAPICITFRPSVFRETDGRYPYILDATTVPASVITWALNEIRAIVLLRDSNGDALKSDTSRVPPPNH